jgi:hypothetical protein
MLINTNTMLILFSEEDRKMSEREHRSSDKSWLKEDHTESRESRTGLLSTHNL